MNRELQLLYQLASDEDTPQEVLFDAAAEAFPDWPEEGGTVASLFMVVGYARMNSYIDADNSSHEWNVGGFLDRRRADKLTEDLNDWCRENGYAPREREPNSGHIASGEIGHYPEFFSSGYGYIPFAVSSGPYVHDFRYQRMRDIASAGSAGSVSSGFVMTSEPPYQTYTEPKCPLDANFRRSPYGTTYRVVEIPLKG